MEQLIKSVLSLKEEEYTRASQEFGATNHSDHEGFALMFEEIQEAMEEVKNTDQRLLQFWGMVKQKDAPNASKQEVLNSIENSAILAACEFIQVATMAHKANKTIEDREE